MRRVLTAAAGLVGVNKVVLEGGKQEKEKELPNIPIPPPPLPVTFDTQPQQQVFPNTNFPLPKLMPQQQPDMNRFYTNTTQPPYYPFVPQQQPQKQVPPSTNSTTDDN